MQTQHSTSAPRIGDIVSAFIAKNPTKPFDATSEASQEFVLMLPSKLENGGRGFWDVALDWTTLANARRYTRDDIKNMQYGPYTGKEQSIFISMPRAQELSDAINKALEVAANQACADSQPAASAPAAISQLSQYRAANGDQLVVGNKTFTIEGITESDIGAVATFKSARTSYMGVECINAKVSRLPGAEVWSIDAGKRHIASFAVNQGRIIPLK